jgi:hypothetical protein
MRYKIYVSGQLLMEVLYISDADQFIRDRMSLGLRVVVEHISSGIKWVDKLADDIADEMGKQSMAACAMG